MELFDRSFSELTALELYDIVRLRVDVFVVEQQCPYGDLDGRDTERGTRHIWQGDAKGVVSYLRVLDEGDVRRIGRVVTRPDARGGGLSVRLLDHVVEATDGPWVLGAQAHLADWYRRLGFVTDGEPYVEDGIPHVPMRREP
ncbi:MAG: GNAT family N-acetyltransferase [Acidimicrobiia bacterium]|nr:GNAT family N-acetyltransferase [Acidimicrobiia bacterium]